LIFFKTWIQSSTLKLFHNYSPLVTGWRNKGWWWWVQFEAQFKYCKPLCCGGRYIPQSSTFCESMLGMFNITYD